MIVILRTLFVLVFAAAAVIAVGTPRYTGAGRTCTIDTSELDKQNHGEPEPFPGAYLSTEAFERAKFMDFNGAVACLNAARSLSTRASEVADRLIGLFNNVGTRIKRWEVAGPVPAAGTKPTAPDTTEGAETPPLTPDGHATKVVTVHVPDSGWHWIPKHVPIKYNPNRLAIFFRMDITNFNLIQDFQHIAADYYEELDFFLVTNSSVLPDAWPYVKTLTHNINKYPIILYERFKVFDLEDRNIVPQLFDRLNAAFIVRANRVVWSGHWGVVGPSLFETLYDRYGPDELSDDEFDEREREAAAAMQGAAASRQRTAAAREKPASQVSRDEL